MIISRVGAISWLKTRWKTRGKYRFPSKGDAASDSYALLSEMERVRVKAAMAILCSSFSTLEIREERHPHTTSSCAHNRDWNLLFDSNSEARGENLKFGILDPSFESSCRLVFFLLPGCAYVPRIWMDFDFRFREEKKKKIESRVNAWLSSRAERKVFEPENSNRKALFLLLGRRLKAICS